MNAGRMTVALVVLLGAVGSLGCGPDSLQSEADTDLAVSTAALSPPCYGSSCNGLNPQTTGCSNPANGSVYILASAPIKDGSNTVGGVELKYSSWCNARWSKTYSYIGLKCVGAIIRNAANTYDIAGTNTYLCNTSDVYGNMYGGVTARGKGYLYMNQYTTSYREAVTSAM